MQGSTQRSARVRSTGKGGAYIADFLVRQRVPYVFGLCGHGVLGLLDALDDHRGEIATSSVRHEAMTFTSCGPGSANLVVAVAAAFADSSGLLAVTGNVPTSQWNRGPFQETGRYFQCDFVDVPRLYVKRSFQPTRADRLPLAAGYRRAGSSRRCPLPCRIRLKRGLTRPDTTQR